MARFIYPDLLEDNPHGRGGLSARLEQASQLGCEWAEVAADLVRDAAEAELTGLSLGEILDASAVARLYTVNDTQVQDGRYVLHTETPCSGPRGESLRAGPPWSDKRWVNRFAEMLLMIARQLGAAPAAVEIQPGDRSQSIADILFGARVIHDRLEKNLGFEPQVWLENRAGQAIQTGRELAAFWQVVWHSPRIPAWLGVVLDVDQLWAATEGSFETELGAIPDVAVRALHVHRRGGAPTLEDEIPWSRVFARRFARAGAFPILPRVHRRSDIEAAIRFCRQQLADQQAAGALGS